MKRFFPLLIVLSILLCLTGCSTASKGSTTQYNTEDVLLDLATRITKQIGQCAEPDYMKMLASVNELVSQASLFTPAATAQPQKARILYTDDTDFSQQLTVLTGSTEGNTRLACSSILSLSTLVSLPVALPQTAVIHLEYSPECQFAVIITPLKDVTASVYGYPLFCNASEALLKQSFNTAKVLDAPEIQAACLRCGDASYSAKLSDKKIGKDHYITLAKSAFANAKAATKEEISVYTTNEEAISIATAVSYGLTLEPFAAAVYQCSGEISAAINDSLSSLQLSKDLREITYQRMYLALPTSYSNSYGDTYVAATAIVSRLTQTQPLGPTAQADEDPVLVLLGLNSQLTVMVSIYPNENNIYCFGYSVVPSGFDELRSSIEEQGMVPVQ